MLLLATEGTVVVHALIEQSRRDFSCTLIDIPAAKGFNILL